MAIDPIDLTGGKSVYCFNQTQITKAHDLVNAEDEAGEKVRAEMARLKEAWTRNEMAAMAFVILDELNKTSPD